MRELSEHMKKFSEAINKPHYPKYSHSTHNYFPKLELSYQNSRKHYVVIDDYDVKERYNVEVVSIKHFKTESKDDVRITFDVYKVGDLAASKYYGSTSLLLSEINEIEGFYPVIESVVYKLLERGK